MTLLGSCARLCQGHATRGVTSTDVLPGVRVVPGRVPTLLTLRDARC